jgi:hypothetical protein
MARGNTYCYGYLKVMEALSDDVSCIELRLAAM